MAPRHWLGVGLVLALLGAILAFALGDSEASKLGLSLQPLGGVLLTAGILLAAGAAIASMSPGKGGQMDVARLRSITGLVAVVAGLTAVAALTVITVTRLGSTDKDSMVAVTSSAFGIVSAMVSAYLGIKITAETTAKAGERVGEEVGKAAVAEHEAEVKEKKISTLNEKRDELVEKGTITQHAADELLSASIAAEEEARAPGPTEGDGAS